MLKSIEALNAGQINRYAELAIEEVLEVINPKGAFIGVGDQNVAIRIDDFQALIATAHECSKLSDDYDLMLAEKNANDEDNSAKIAKLEAQNAKIDAALSEAVLRVEAYVESSDKYLRERDRAKAESTALRYQLETAKAVAENLAAERDAMHAILKNNGKTMKSLRSFHKQQLIGNIISHTVGTMVAIGAAYVLLWAVATYL